MASVFKMKQRPCWMIAWLDASGRRRIRSSGSTDRRAAERLVAELEKRELLVRSGLADPRQDAIAAAAREPVAKHLTAFLNHLRNKGNGEKHLSDREGQLTRLLAACRILRLADLTPSRVQAGIAELRAFRGISISTLNRYQRATQGFSRWLVREGKLASDPLLGLSAKNPEPDRRHERRALNADEVATLIAAAERGDEYRGLSGPDRAMLYRLALGTGFRASELASLTAASFRLDEDPPLIVVEAGYAKNRRQARQPIRRDLADLLRLWLGSRPSDRPVFDVPHLHHRTAAYMRHDLEAAGIPYVDPDGRVADFHSLRVAYVSALIKAGVSPKEAQLLARHSDPTLTLRVYAKVGIQDLGRALDRLPATAAQERVAGKRVG